MFNYKNKSYIAILKSELEKRILKNSRYSIRAFARDLNIPNSTLSEILNGITGISIDRAIKISEKLQFSKEETDYFCNLIELHNAKSENAKKRAKEKLNKFQNEEFVSLKMDVYKSMSDWWHFAILELTFVNDFLFTPENIAKRLSITTQDANEAIERLIRLEQLELKNGRYKSVDNFSETTHDIPSEAIRQQHKSLLDRAAWALDVQTVDERNFSSMIMSFKKNQMPECKKFLMKVRRDFNKKFTSEKDADSVYALTINFYNLLNNDIQERKIK